MSQTSPAAWDRTTGVADRLGVVLVERDIFQPQRPGIASGADGLEHIDVIDLAGARLLAALAKRSTNGASLNHVSRLQA